MSTYNPKKKGLSFLCGFRAAEDMLLVVSSMWTFLHSQELSCNTDLTCYWKRPNKATTTGFHHAFRTQTASVAYVMKLDRQPFLCTYKASVILGQEMNLPEPLFTIEVINRLFCPSMALIATEHPCKVVWSVLNIWHVLNLPHPLFKPEVWI